jgi:hypothetical protein
VIQKTPLTELLTGPQRIALDKLTCLLALMPDDYKGFEMGHFAENRNTSYNPGDDYTPKCGTSCCAMGHLPLLGYKGQHREDWIAYSYRITGLSPSDFLDNAGEVNNSPENVALWNWMFSCSWADHTNTAKHAAMRIAFALDYYDTYPGVFNCPRHGAADAQAACYAMVAIGEEALLGNRRKVPLMELAPRMVE